MSCLHFHFSFTRVAFSSAPMSTICRKKLLLYKAVACLIDEQTMAYIDCCNATC